MAPDWPGHPASKQSQIGLTKSGQPRARRLGSVKRPQGSQPAPELTGHRPEEGPKLLSEDCPLHCISSCCAQESFLPHSYVAACWLPPFPIMHESTARRPGFKQASAGCTAASTAGPGCRHWTQRLSIILSFFGVQRVRFKHWRFKNN